MGMYTKLHLEGELNKRGIAEAKPVLEWMLGGTKPDKLPDHKLFTKRRAEWMLRSCSFYHFPFATSLLRDDTGSYFLFNCDLKDYEDEIATFIDWLTPFVERAWGFTRYEEDGEVTPIRLHSLE